MLPRIEDVTLETLQTLIGTPEGLMTDFKEALPLSNREEKREFLADVAAFANAAGGEIFIGITERNEGGARMGVATGVLGVECNPDNAILSIESLLRDGISPRINGLRMVAIEVTSGRYVLAMRIPRSWTGPHMVALGDSRFFGRNSRGKYGLDVTQIRSAFSESERQADRLREFRDDRIGRVIARDTPVLLHALPTSLTHLVPTNAFSRTASVDVRAYQDYVSRLADPAKMFSPHKRYNLDGFCLSQGSPLARSYVQCFRNGVIEFGDAYYLPMRREGFETSVATERFEESIIRQVHAGLDVMHCLETPTPVVILVSVVGVKGWRLDYRDGENLDLLFDRDVLVLPDIQLESHDDDFVSALKPLFDTFWQCAGADQSRHRR